PLDMRLTPVAPAAYLPPFPLVGLGNPAHPLAAALDAVVESPISADALIRQVARSPHAAAVAIQLLRNADGLPVERALQLESMCYGLLQGSAEHQAWLAQRDSRRVEAPGNLIVERQESALHLVIDRPHAHNAIDRSLRDQLFEAFTLAQL